MRMFMHDFMEYFPRQVAWQQIVSSGREFATTQMQPIIGEVVNYHVWAEMIVKESDWWNVPEIMQRFSHKLSIYSEGFPDEANRNRFFQFYEHLPLAERTLVLRKMFNQLNAGSIEGPDLSYFAQLYETTVAAFDRKIGLLTNLRPLMSMYAERAKEFLVAAGSYRQVYDEKIGDRNEREDAIKSRTEKKAALNLFFQFNPSPEFLKKILIYWNQQLSPGAPARKRKSGLKTGQQVKLISDRELNAFNWIINNIPKGGNTRDERRRLHAFMMELVERRIQREDDPVAKFMSDLVVYINTKLEGKDQRSETVLRFIDFAVFYANLPKIFVKNRLKPMQTLLEQFKAESPNEMAVLQARHYEVLLTEMSQLLVSNMFESPIVLKKLVKFRKFKGV